MLNLQSAQLMDQPFRHFALNHSLSKPVGDKLLDWFETKAPWKSQESPGFYKLRNVDLLKIKLPSDIEMLTRPDFLERVRTELERIFCKRLGRTVEVDAHLMTPGLQIGIHTDFGETPQTHRLVIQLNRGWTLPNGGLLALLPERKPKDLSTDQKFYPPLHCSAVGFELSQHSFHAVTPVVHGERYTLCYSVWDS